MLMIERLMDREGNTGWWKKDEGGARGRDKCNVNADLCNSALLAVFAPSFHP